MKRLLLLLDSDPMPNSYDIIVGYDGGVDHIVSYGGITSDNVGCLIDSAVFTRGPSPRCLSNISLIETALRGWACRTRTQNVGKN